MSGLVPRHLVDAEADIALSVDGLQIAFRSARGSEVVVQDVSFVVRRGKTVALVGESGSGKSVSCLALMGLFDCIYSFLSSGPGYPGLS